MAILSRPRPDRWSCAPTSVLIVDDSAVARAALACIVEESRVLALAGRCQSADEAIEWLKRRRVDIVLLDVDMPRRSGLAALPEILAHAGPARVLIVSGSAHEGAAATVEALALGAADTLAKPGAEGMGRQFGALLVDRIERLAREADAPSSPFPLRHPSTAPVRVVGVGASTGGIRALAEFFSALPPEFDAPVLVTQHLPAPFIPYFAAQLRAIAGRRVGVATENARLERGAVLIAPGNRHLLLAPGQDRTRLSETPSASRCCPSVDPMFESLAELGEQAVGVVLSGMGRDGGNGAASLVAAGGTILAQDERTSTVWGMPGTVARAGLASLVAAPADLALHLAERGAC